MNFTLGPEPGGASSLGSRPDTYEVVPGDTMWDICARFWGDPYFWPQLWAYNPSVGNAHFIYPTELLKFTTGSSVRPPGLAVGDDSPGSAAFPDSSEEETPQFYSPSQVVASGESNVLECGPPIGFREGDEKTVSASVTSFIQKEKIKPIGKLVRSPEPKTFLGNRDVLYLQFARLSEVSCGDVFTVYREDGRRVTYPESARRLGRRYRILGEVRIVDVNDAYATGRVTTSFEEMERGDLLKEFEPVRREVELRTATKEIEGEIIASATSEKSSLVQRSTVYINLGSDDGVTEGDGFYILRKGDGMIAYSRSDAGLPDQVIGKLVVIESHDNYSAALITESVDSLEVGDRVSMQVY